MPHYEDPPEFAATGTNSEFYPGGKPYYLYSFTIVEKSLTNMDSYSLHFY